MGDNSYCLCKFLRITKNTQHNILVTIHWSMTDISVVYLFICLCIGSYSWQFLWCCSQWICNTHIPTITLSNQIKEFYLPLSRINLLYLAKRRRYAMKKWNWLQYRWLQVNYLNQTRHIYFKRHHLCQQ